MRHRCAFTLIELLLVVAIIGILAGLVMAAMQTVRSSARTASCASNLRQIGMGLTAFGNDHRGQIPPPKIDKPADLDRNGKSDIDEQPDRGNWWGFLRLYLPDTVDSSVFLCPDGNWTKKEIQDFRDRVPYDDNNDPTRFERSSIWCQSSYGYNEYLGSRGWVVMNSDGTHGGTALDGNATADNMDIFPGKNVAWKSWRISKIPSTSQTPALTELWSIGSLNGSKAPLGGFSFRGDAEAMAGTGHTRDFNADEWRAIRLSHRNKANHVFFDGHVKAHNPEELRPKDLARFWDANVVNAYRGRL